MTIGEMARVSGVTIRTLRHYDRIGLLHPSRVTDSGYRCYDESDLQRLYLIRVFREVEMPLKDIRRILDRTDLDIAAVLDGQLRLLTMRREHISRLIEQVQHLQTKGLSKMDFTNFDSRQQADRRAQAQAAFGNTPAWQEFEQMENARHPRDSERYGEQLMAMLAEFGRSRPATPDSAAAQGFVQQLRDFLTAHFYTCTVPILRGLADLYESSDFTGTIDQAGGAGTAAFLACAMRLYCNRQ